MINIVKVKNDLSGQKFGRLTVVKQVEDYINKQGRHRAMYECICDCSNHTRINVLATSLKSGNTKSCGCLHKELLSKQNVETKKKYNIYDLSNEYGIGYATNTNKPFYFDKDDYDLIKNYCWYEDNKGYIKVSIKNKNSKHNLLLHRLVTHCSSNMCVDHIDHNPKNNRKNNLRICEHKDNMKNYSKPKNNTSGVTGVSWDSYHERWIAYITYDSKRISLGYFQNKEDAIITRLKAEQEYFNEYSAQKHLFKKYGI